MINASTICISHFINTVDIKIKVIKVTKSTHIYVAILYVIMVRCNKALCRVPMKTLFAKF